MEVEDREGYVRRLAAGDPEALGTLYVSRYEELLRRAVAITREPAMAEDVVHDVFRDLPRTIRTYSGRGTLEAWVARVIDRAAHGALRRENTRQRLVRRVGALAGGSHHPDDLARLMLEEAVLLLRRELRTVWMLKEVFGYTHEEIGQRLGITWQASAQRLFRARLKLRDLLDAVPGETDRREHRDAG